MDSIGSKSSFPACRAEFRRTDGPMSFGLGPSERLISPIVVTAEAAREHVNRWP